MSYILSGVKAAKAFCEIPAKNNVEGAIKILAESKPSHRICFSTGIN